MLCRNCGKELVEGAKFCEFCGYKAGFAGDEDIASGQRQTKIWKLILFIGCGIAAVTLIVLASIYLPKIFGSPKDTLGSGSETAETIASVVGASEDVDQKGDSCAGVPEETTYADGSETINALLSPTDTDELESGTADPTESGQAATESAPSLQETTLQEQPEPEPTAIETTQQEQTQPKQTEPKQTEPKQTETQQTEARREKSPDDVIEFSDSNLEQAVRDALGKPSGYILRRDVETITSLSAYERGIKDINGIQNLVNLAYLEIFNNEITDISPLAPLTKLTNVYLCYNQITKVDALQYLTNLVDLSIGGNKVKDISPLAKLVKLQYLNISENSITNIQALKNMTQLTTLYMDGNTISDYSPVESIYQNLEDYDFTLP